MTKTQIAKRTVNALLGILVVSVLVLLASPADAGKKTSILDESVQDDLNNGKVVCLLNSSGNIMCNCKQGTEACGDMIKNSCEGGRANCGSGYCSCEAKDSLKKSSFSLRIKSLGSGTVVAPTPAKPKKSQNRLKLKSLSNSTFKSN